MNESRQQSRFLAQLHTADRTIMKSGGVRLGRSILTRSLRQEQQRIPPCLSLAIVGHPVPGHDHFYYNNVRRLFSETTTATASPTPAPIKIPSNLTFDPKSSFAPRSSYVLKKKNIPLPSKKSMINEHDEKRKKAAIAVVDEDEDEDDGEKLDDAAAGEDLDDDVFIAIPQVQYAKPLPDRLNVEIHTLLAPEHSTLCGTIILDESVFGKDPIRVDLLKRAVNYYRNKLRGRRKAKTKELSEVSGSRRKVRQQKRSGQARAGHSRPAHWRGGYKAHGPTNETDYGKTKLNKKVRKLALRHVLSQKLKEGNLLILNQLSDLPTYRTNDLAKLLDPWDIAGRNAHSAFCLDHYTGPDESNNNDDKSKPEAVNYLPVNLVAASGNLPHWKVGNSHAANVYEILRHDKLLLTLSALQQIEQRLKE
jgi:large subunit ribosomal protein L4